METKNNTVIAVGDIHGELDGLIEILRHSGLIDSGDNWTGGTSILIQTGDVVDRGPCSWDAFLFLQKLQEQARKNGGDVIRILGNHELMLLQGEYCFTDYKEPERLAGLIREDIRNGNIKAATCLCSRIFIHAAVRLAIIKSLDSNLRNSSGSFEEMLVKEMNSILKRAVITGDFSHPLFSDSGIFWSRYEADLCDTASHDIKQVFGHTIGNDIRASDSCGRICIDIGLWFSGCRAYLNFKDGKIIAVMDSSGLWKENTLGEY